MDTVSPNKQVVDTSSILNKHGSHCKDIFIKKIVSLNHNPNLLLTFKNGKCLFIHYGKDSSTA